MRCAGIRDALARGALEPLGSPLGKSGFAAPRAPG